MIFATETFLLSHYLNPLPRSSNHLLATLGQLKHCASLPPLLFFFWLLLDFFLIFCGANICARSTHTHTQMARIIRFWSKRTSPQGMQRKVGREGGGGRGQKNSGKRNENPCHVFCHKHKPASITTKTPTHPMQTNAGNAKQSSCPFITINTSRQLRLDRGPSTLRPPALLHTSAHPLPLVPHDHTSSWY